MTAWLESPDGQPDFFLDRLRCHVEGGSEGDKFVGAVELVMGMTQLCGGLLLTLAEATGASTRETLQEFALLYADQD